jgi:hypothetical protein
MSDTPRTDDQIGWGGSTMTLVRIDFARDLERELAKAKKDAERYRLLRDHAQNTLIGVYISRWRGWFTRWMGNRCEGG